MKKVRRVYIEVLVLFAIAVALVLGLFHRIGLIG